MSTPHRTIGSGPHTVFCLHGWYGSSTGWGEDFCRALDGEGFRYVFVDYRGYGERRDVDGEHTMEEVARDVLALADELGVERFSLIGHSMGGSAAQRVLAVAPERVRRLIGISSVPAEGVPLDEQGEALFSGAAQQDENRFAIVDLTTGNRLCTRWVDSIVQHSVERSTREAFADYFRSWSAGGFADEVKGNPVPALSIVGQHDPALGEATATATWMQTYPHARLEVMPNAGHYAMFETPIALVTSIERFLTE
ncbi:MAG TPA: alpha/beta hydrolase [Segeticoccus sp.]|uniref:alpha/beta fold hydrolase n=1 Tax=Segeticoccus sp. TaxID=2706531 RepID=UPI002D806327|nr:alpha/beta hydrolase [Segeticoccus sp.]HET8601707.1 alpha/beta hydrolase [Segeticoccus sp.]